MLKRKAGLIGLIIMSLVLTGLTGCQKKEETVKDVPQAVSVVTVKQGDIARVVSYSGTVKGANEATLYPKVSSRVVAVNLKEGDRVRNGQTILTLDTTDYATRVSSANAMLSQALANETNARLNLERTQQLFQQGAVSQQQMEQADTGMIQTKAAVEQARASVQDASNMLANCRVTSPIDGVVGLVSITVGNMATPQQAVAVVSTVDKVRVAINVNESDISYIKEGGAVGVRIESLGGKPVNGTVTKVAAVADARLRAFPVEVFLPNPDGMIKSGMFAQVNLPTETKSGVIVLPRTAVAEKGARRVVFVVNSKLVVEEREVKLGIESDDQIEILSGLKTGDRVVVKGQTLLHDRDKVRVVEE